MAQRNKNKQELRGKASAKPYVNPAKRSVAPPVLQVSVAMNGQISWSDIQIFNFKTSNDLAYAIAEASFCLADEILAKNNVELPTITTEVVSVNDEDIPF